MTAQLPPVYLPLQFNQILDIVKQLGAKERQQLLLFLLGRQPFEQDDAVLLTHFATESVLAKDWLTETEDTAWQSL
jgi:hypothetical protein